MRMKIHKIKTSIVAVCLLLLGMTGQALAQDDWYGAFTYQLSFPTGDTKTYINDISWRGVGLEWRKLIEPKTSVGVMFGWNVFHERVTGSFEIPSGAVWGTQDRYINSYPMMLSVDKYLGEKGDDYRPYFGLNAGGFIVSQRFAVGIVQFSNDSWEWGIAPEIGVIVPMNRDNAFIINARYNYAFTTNELGTHTYNLSYIGLNVGFVWQE